MDEPKTPEEAPDQTTLSLFIGNKPNGEPDLAIVEKSTLESGGSASRRLRVSAKPIPDEPKPAQPKMLDENLAATVALESTVTQAFQSMAETMLGMRRQMEVTDGMLKQILAERRQLVDLVTRLSDQVQTFAKLQDSDHAAVEVLMMSQGAPKGRDVN
jgi:hypothetical protein